MHEPEGKYWCNKDGGRVFGAVVFNLVKNLPDIPSGFSTRYSTSLVIAVLVASFRAFVVVVIHASWLAGYSGRRPRDGPGLRLLWRVSIWRVAATLATLSWPIRTKVEIFEWSENGQKLHFVRPHRIGAHCYAVVPRETSSFLMSLISFGRPGWPFSRRHFLLAIILSYNVQWISEILNILSSVRIMVMMNVIIDDDECNYCDDTCDYCDDECDYWWWWMWLLMMIINTWLAETVYRTGSFLLRPDLLIP